MPLTGRFTFRKSLFGRIVLRVEEDAPLFWPLSGRIHRRWRDARFMDLVQPEIRGLLNLRDYAQEMPEANFAAAVLGRVRRRQEPDRLPRPEPPPTTGHEEERRRTGTLHGTVV